MVSNDEIRIVSQDGYRNLLWSPVTNEAQLNSMGSGVRETQNYGQREYLTKK